MKYSSVVSLILAFFSFQAYALAQSSSVQEFPSSKELVEKYYELKELGLHSPKHFPPHCRPQRGSCFRTACETVDQFECDDQHEMDTLRRACRGNWGDACLKTSVSFLDRFEYDDLEEMAELADSCRGISDTECIRYTCERMGSFACDDLDEIKEVNRRCSGDLR